VVIVTKKKEEKVSENHKKTDVPLSSLLLDCSKDKYRLVALATRWAHELKHRDQDPLPPQMLLDKALREILTGLVDMEEIEKLPPVPKVEKKPLELMFKPFSDKTENGKGTEEEKTTAKK
jgi:DNA-directed RNA polymerase omega subunit